MIGSTVALFGVFLSNRTNRKAIDAADERSRTELSESRDRDFRTWRRDTLLKLADEVVEAAIDAGAEYAKAVQLGPTWDQEQFRASIEIVDARGRRIGASIARLRLIGAHEAANRCVKLRDAINHRDLVRTLIEAATAPKSQISAALHGNAESLIAEVGAAQQLRDTLLGEIELARGAFGEAVEQELARTNQPLSPTSEPAKRRRWYFPWRARG